MSGGGIKPAKPFREAAKGTLADAQMRRNLRHATTTIREKRQRAVSELPDWEALRVAGAAIKDEALSHLGELLPKFVKVLPKDYKRMLACIERARGQGLTGDEAIMAAFEENARDLSRVGGN